jgi:hypothetical protein
LSFGEKVYTTSNWVIQESGFALGSGRNVLFIVEKGINRFPELQGDLELVYFNRNSLESDAFQRLSEMIQFIIGKSAAKAMGNVPNLPTQANEGETLQNGSAAGNQTPGEFFEVFQALVVERDAKKARELYDGQIRPHLVDRLTEAAIVLRILHRLGDEEAFKELVVLASKHADNPVVRIQLAHRYYDMMDYEKATAEYLATSMLYDLTTPKGRMDYVEARSLAAKSLALEGHYFNGQFHLTSLLLSEQFSDQKANILSRLAYLAKKNKKMNEFITFGEASLHGDSSNTSLRFDLAYHYSESEYKKLALLHYKKYSDTIEEAGGLNNLGVQYSVLGMQVKAVASYLSSARYKNTLAMANLAQKYLDVGFAERARDEINKANALAGEGIEVHGNIGVAKNRLDEVLLEEETKEREALERGKLESDFIVEYYAKHDIRAGANVIARRWVSPWGIVHLLIDESTGFIKAEESLEIPETLWNARVEAGYGTTTKMKIRQISFAGFVEGSSILYNIKVVDKRASLGDTTIHEAEGFMFITEDNMTMRAMEKRKEVEPEFVNWKAAV